MRKSLLLGICIVSLSTVAAEDVHTLLAKVENAYGGRAALESITALRQTGHVEAAMRVGSSGPVVRTFARPLKLRVEIGETSKPSEVRVLDGAKGWRNGKEASGMGYEAMVLQAVRLDLPLQLISREKVLVEKEAVDYQGKRLRVLELPLEHGLSMRAGIEPETGRILFSAGTTSAGSGGTMSFETRYDDFRMVEGRLFAFKEANLAGETKTADITLSKVELLTGAPEGAFKP